ncbi:MAG: dihydrolipoamide dehydrogenase [Clostridiales bacterium]|nr:dihydrolipoamide dehydrogenase [Clostridiales bacterium]
MSQEYDVIVIGAGPGGYVAAIHAAKLGLKTALIEKREVGGTCLNRGCIPTKALLHAALVYEEAKHAAQFGIVASEVQYNYEKVLAYQNETVETLRNGVRQLIKENHVELFYGSGMLLKDGSVRLQRKEGEEILTAKDIILATGAKAVIPSFLLERNDTFLTSDQMLTLPYVPKELMIIGGGVIGIEFAQMVSSFGGKVSIYEAADRILPGFDVEISRSISMLFQKRGIQIHTKATTEEMKASAWKREGELLVATGRSANMEGLFEEADMLTVHAGKIVTDATLKTSMPHVYAIGDLIGGMQLAHKASAQGIYVAEQLAGRTPSLDLLVIPSCIYLDPEVACVGLSVEEAKRDGIQIVTKKSLTSANGKSVITKQQRGFIKVVAHKETKQILGAQLMCHGATDMIAEFGTAIANHMTAADLWRAMRPHPTYNEAIGEALEQLL